MIHVAHLVCIVGWLPDLQSGKDSVLWKNPIVRILDSVLDLTTPLQRHVYLCSAYLVVCWLRKIAMVVRIYVCIHYLFLDPPSHIFIDLWSDKHVSAFFWGNFILQPLPDAQTSVLGSSADLASYLISIIFLIFRKQTWPSASFFFVLVSLGFMIPY